MIGVRVSLKDAGKRLVGRNPKVLWRIIPAMMQWCCSVYPPWRRAALGCSSCFPLCIRNIYRVWGKRVGDTRRSPPPPDTPRHIPVHPPPHPLHLFCTRPGDANSTRGPGPGALPGCGRKQRLQRAGGEAGAAADVIRSLPRGWHEWGAS